MTIVSSWNMPGWQNGLDDKHWSMCLMIGMLLLLLLLLCQCLSVHGYGMQAMSLWN